MSPRRQCRRGLARLSCCHGALGLGSKMTCRLPRPRYGEGSSHPRFQSVGQLPSMPHPLHGPNRFKLGIFSTNANGGLAITTVPERWTATWEGNVAAARIADTAGFEFFLPIARWRGFGGSTRAREWSFETFTWAAGLA